MPKKKKIFIAETDNISWQKQVENLCRNLYYISETDSSVQFFKGEKAEAVNSDSVLARIKHDKDSETAIKEVNFKDFFARLTKIEDWFGEEEKEWADKFERIQKLLEKHLVDLKVFKIGQIELDVYVVGLDAEGILSGIRTKAVET